MVNAWALAFLLYHFDWKLPQRMKNEDLDLTEQFGATVDASHLSSFVDASHLSSFPGKINHVLPHDY